MFHLISRYISAQFTISLKECNGVRLGVPMKKKTSKATKMEMLKIKKKQKSIHQEAIFHSKLSAV